jgi:cellulose synthase/poly-beta-1,6-N-acetylglucosamine synthase-like glycosyltransferase
MIIVKNEPRELVLKNKIIAPYYIAGVFLFLSILILLVTWFSSLENPSTNLVVGFSLLIFGVISVLFGGEKNFTFNKNSQMLVVTNRRHIRKKENEYALSDIISILEEVSLQQRAPRLAIFYSLILKNNKKISLSLVGQHGSYEGHKLIKKTEIPLFIQAIALFLDIPINTKYNFKVLDDIIR